MESLVGKNYRPLNLPILETYANTSTYGVEPQMPRLRRDGASPNSSRQRIPLWKPHRTQSRRNRCLSSAIQQPPCCLCARLQFQRRVFLFQGQTGIERGG